MFYVVHLAIKIEKVIRKYILKFEVVKVLYPVDVVKYVFMLK